MEVGIREAKNKLSSLIDAVNHGEEVYLTSRGTRVAQITSVQDKSAARLGRGMLKGKINFYAGWDSPEEDKRIEDMFERLREDA